MGQSGKSSYLCAWAVPGNVEAHSWHDSQTLRAHSPYRAVLDAFVDDRTRATDGSEAKPPLWPTPDADPDEMIGASYVDGDDGTDNALTGVRSESTLATSGIAGVRSSDTLDDTDLQASPPPAQPCPSAADVSPPSENSDGFVRVASTESLGDRIDHAISEAIGDDVEGILAQHASEGMQAAVDWIQDNPIAARDELELEDVTSSAGVEAGDSGIVDV